MSLNLYLISQNHNDNYDTYDEAVVAAEDEDKARNTHPSGKPESVDEIFGTWVKPDLVKVELIGIALGDIKAGVICASYNAG